MLLTEEVLWDEDLLTFLNLTSSIKFCFVLLFTFSGTRWIPPLPRWSKRDSLHVHSFLSMKGNSKGINKWKMIPCNILELIYIWVMQNVFWWKVDVKKSEIVPETDINSASQTFTLYFSNLYYSSMMGITPILTPEWLQGFSHEGHTIMTPLTKEALF